MISGLFFIHHVFSYSFYIVILQYNKQNMGVTKSEIFTASQNQVANFAKVMGHPARIAILQHLMTLRECVCKDLVNEIGLAQATISQHLNELKNIGLIKGVVEGTSVCYCIDPEAWEKMKVVLVAFLSQEIQNTKCHC